MSRLTVLVTSPRIPASMLTAQAWQRLHQAEQVLAADRASPIARAVTAADIEVGEGRPDAVALLKAAAGADIVWLAADDGDDALTRALAAAVVDAAEAGGPQPEIDVLVGSFDPPGARLLDLVEVMDRLRRECPWDRKQTHESLIRYLVEETYETIDAIESGDPDHLREELGDLLLQVYFHARLAEEDAGSPYNIDDVAAGIVEKLIRRHPHVFADADADDAEAVERNWAAIKADEKKDRSPTEGIPRGLPALSLATKYVDRAVASSTVLSVPYPEEPTYTADALGDVLFALVAAAHSAGIDAELALRQRILRELDGPSPG